jgi:hypothetical protein
LKVRDFLRVTFLPIVSEGGGLTPSVVTRSSGRMLRTHRRSSACRNLSATARWNQYGRALPVDFFFGCHTTVRVARALLSGL